MVKIVTVKLVLECNMSVSDVTKELWIHYNYLYVWISEYEDYGKVRYLDIDPQFIYISMK
ncbi:transposase [Clostridium cellulovorans]|uniref:transposase n=1 Tax=Clostridium cellulovorans TaxID=1493 RepID=UPI0001E8ED19|nr:transposase [Clostridium cellulovorans]